MEKKIWEIDVTYKSVIDLPVAQFILDQGEKSLSYINDGSNKITNRAFSLLLIMIPVISTILGFLISEGSKHKSANQTNVIFYGIILAVSSIVLLFLIRLIFPRKFMERGREPKAIATKEMLINSLSPEKKLLSFTLNEIKNCQQKIDYNRNQNEQRIEVLRRILATICGTFIVSIIFYLVTLAL